MKIILFGGRGSGKDTVGDYLFENHGFNKESFANPLKQMAKIAFPDLKDEDLYGPSKNREIQYEQYAMGNKCLRCGHSLVSMDDDPRADLGCTKCGMEYPRFLNSRIILQTLGTEWGRRLFQTVWIDGAFTRMKIASEGADPFSPADRDFVVTDGRFINEQARSVELGGITVLLLRKLEEAEKATHASERELSMIPREKFQYILDNRCPLEELPAKIEEMMRVLTNR